MEEPGEFFVPAYDPTRAVQGKWEHVKSPMEIIVDTIVVDHTARILDLEKQVADLRALLKGGE